MSKYGGFSGPNTGKYGPEKNPYLGTFHAYGDFQSKSPYSVRIKKDADQKNYVFGRFSRSARNIKSLKTLVMLFQRN